MVKRRRKSTKGGAGAFVLLLIVVTLAPYLAIVAGLIAFVWLLTKIVKLSLKPQRAVAAPRITVAPLRSWAGLEAEVEALCRSARKPGKWQTQLVKLQEIQALQERIRRTAVQAPDPGVKSLITKLDGVQNDLASQASRSINNHYLKELEKLQLGTGSARSTRICKGALDQLKHIHKAHSALENLARTLILQFQQKLDTLEHSASLKSRMYDAQQAQRSGDRDAALSQYLELLYALRTDDIDDTDQAEILTDIEHRVRTLVASYAPKKRRQKPV